MQESADLVTFTKETFNGKRFWYSVMYFPLKKYPISFALYYLGQWAYVQHC